MPRGFALPQKTIWRPPNSNSLVRPAFLSSFFLSRNLFCVAALLACSSAWSFDLLRAERRIFFTSDGLGGESVLEGISKNGSLGRVKEAEVDSGRISTGCDGDEEMSEEARVRDEAELAEAMVKIEEFVVA